MMKLGHVPSSFGKSYTVPIIKGGINSHGKSVTVDDFRGIVISPVLSKVRRQNSCDKFYKVV